MFEGGSRFILLSAAACIFLSGCVSLKTFQDDDLQKEWRLAKKAARDNRAEILPKLDNNTGLYVIVDTENEEVAGMYPGNSPEDAWIRHAAGVARGGEDLETIDLPTEQGKVGVFLPALGQSEKPYVVASAEVARSVRREMGVLFAINDLRLDMIEMKAFFIVLQQSDEMQNTNINKLSESFSQTTNRVERLSDRVSELKNTQTSTTRDLKDSIDQVIRSVQNVEDILNNL